MLCYLPVNRRMNTLYMHCTWQEYIKYVLWIFPLAHCWININLLIHDIFMIKRWYIKYQKHTHETFSHSFTLYLSWDFLPTVIKKHSHNIRVECLSYLFFYHQTIDLVSQYITLFMINPHQPPKANTNLSSVAKFQNLANRF